MFSLFKKSSKQGQSQQGTGLAVQAGKNVTINFQGITASEVRALALDVFKANLLEFRGIAQSLAIERGEAITDKFISMLQAENPDGLQQAQSPDFQDALFTVQKEFAKANDQALGELLVDLLVDRTKQNSRNLLQLVLTESLNTAPKLTSGQIATLTVVFILRHTQNNAGTLDSLREFLEANVKPFISDMATSSASFGQLEFTGCGSVSISQLTLEDVFQQTYAGLFRKGFDEYRPTEMQIPVLQYPMLYTRCLNDPSKLQIRALNQDQLRQVLDGLTLPPDVRVKFENLFNEGMMTHDEVRIKIIEIAPFFEPLFHIWNTTSLKQFLLTSVGMAIGHANGKRITKVDVAPLSIWIN